LTSNSDPDRKLMYNLVKTLGYLPLAIEHAAAYLLGTSAPLGNYITEFEAMNKKLENILRKQLEQSLWLYKNGTAFTTNEISLSRIQDVQPEIV
jgi:hypothetical protein